MGPNRGPARSGAGQIQHFGPLQSRLGLNHDRFSAVTRQATEDGKVTVIPLQPQAESGAGFWPSV